MKRTRIIINLQFEALHHWPGCDIKGKEYLKDLHRHTFFITCKKTVTHDDRAIEIISFKEQIRRALFVKFPEHELASYVCNLGSTSCEQLASWLVSEFNLDHCTVLEDNENGAEVEREYEMFL